MDIDGTALVTGAGSGIGRDVCLSYAIRGASAIVIMDINEQAAQVTLIECEKFKTNPQFKAHVFVGDVSCEDDVNELAAFAVRNLGRIDYCVNSAGVGVEVPNEVSEASLHDFERFWNVNVRGTLLCMKAQSAAMKKQEVRMVSNDRGTALRNLGRGVIINLGSCNSFAATPHIIQYTTAKHAVLGMTKTAALDNAPYGIRVNAVCPGWVDTPMLDKAIAGDPNLEPLIQSLVPMKRKAEVDEISDVIMFLSSGRASYVTGASWIVDGGTTLGVAA